jgi:hypothetical protein
MFLMFALTLADGLCCALFIYLYISQLSRFNLKTETKSRLRNVACFKKQDNRHCPETQCCTGEAYAIV